MTADERDAARRQRLLLAGLDLIGRQGYAATTVPRLCADAKVSTRHFYDLYSSKEEMFGDLYDDLTLESYRRVAASLEETRGRPLQDRVPAAVLAYIHPMLGDPRVARIAFVEIVGVSPRIEQARLDYRETLIALVAAEGGAAVTNGEIADRDWRFAALALVGAVTTAAYDWVGRSDRGSREVFEAKLAGVAVQILTR